MTPDPDLFARILDPASRADPYPLFARLRDTPVSLQANGIFVASRYTDVAALLHDPRIGSDQRKLTRPPPTVREFPSFLLLDPPAHDRLRREVMRHFTPARVAGLRPFVARLARRGLDAWCGHDRFDAIEDLAYPLPVTVICELLGVPREDEPRFHPWVEAAVRIIDPQYDRPEEETRWIHRAWDDLRAYVTNLVAERRARPTDDLLSDLANGEMADPDLASTLVLLLIAGHETTVNLIGNGLLALLRHPEALDRLRREPTWIVPLVEEVLRYDPPVQFLMRTTLADLEMGGVTIPKGAPVALVIAGANRDERRFPDADRFWPDRPDNVHLGFGGGIHICVGAPLARLEAHVVLSELARRLVAPRLLADPPPYRVTAGLRGPCHLPIAFERILECPS